MPIESYHHHREVNFVDSELKGKHRQHCLCYQCDSFKPQSRDENCPIANKLYQICVDENVVTPVYECPRFILRQD